MAATFRYRLTLAYVGTSYGGWQRQSNTVAIQQVVEEALEPIVGGPVRIFGAGRTDAGVHAEGQVAHLELVRPLAADALVGGVNHHLPDDIRVMDACVVGPDFDARGSAVAKEYRYRMSRRRVVSPSRAMATLRVDEGIDVARLQSAADLVVGRHDFSAFAKSGGSHTQPWRRVFRSQVMQDGPELTYVCIGDGFLRGMVRALVGTLLWIGQGRLDVEAMSSLLAGGRRAEAGPSAAARGLCLARVFYPGDAGFHPGDEGWN